MVQLIEPLVPEIFLANGSFLATLPLNADDIVPPAAKTAGLTVVPLVIMAYTSVSPSSEPMIYGYPVTRQLLAAA